MLVSLDYPAVRFCVCKNNVFNSCVCTVFCVTERRRTHIIDYFKDFVALYEFYASANGKGIKFLSYPSGCQFVRPLTVFGAMSLCLVGRLHRNFPQIFIV